MIDEGLPPDDGLKWFGEGFEGFPKRLPDDCVEYVIYVLDEELKDAFATRTRLQQIVKITKDWRSDLLKDYIWQRDPFNLRILPDVSSQTPKPESVTPQLEGRVNFGDSVADEWLVIYLLLELSKKCPDAWIRVYDTDGEFLLIEAANALPKWLNPEVAENRVWISNGHLRIIPNDETSLSGSISTRKALDFVRMSPEKLIISPFIEDEAFFRIRDYPSAITSSLHHAQISIPRKLAYLLHKNATFVSPAVESFYLRDPVSLKPLATKDLSTLTFAPEDFVMVSVKFTKVGYAQLRSQVFDAPPAWIGIAPRLDDARVSIGMKLGCGFEMLLSDPANQDRQSVREMKLLLSEIDGGEETLPTNKDIASWQQTQDDEKWLDIDYADFEEELSGRSKSKTESNGKKKGDGFGDQHAQENLRKMVSRFEEFLKDESAGVDGVEDKSSDDEESDDDDDDDDDADGNDHDDDTTADKEKIPDAADFEQAMKAARLMPPEEIEKNGLLEEARKLAIADAEEGSEMDEDEEMKQVMALMEKELKGHGALNLNDNKKTNAKAKSKASRDADGASKPSKRVQFGPERPPGMLPAHVEDDEDDDDEIRPLGPGDEDLQPGDGELSSDDEEFNDVDLELAKNMLEAFKGQSGMAGPAGNLMKALGVNMPRDEANDDVEK
nr:protein ecdysoneless like [Quercus suber]